MLRLYLIVMLDCLSVRPRHQEPFPAPRTVLGAADISVSLLNEREKENKACGHYRQPQPLGLRNSGTKLKNL